MRSVAVRVMVLYVPLAAALLAWLARPMRRRMGAAVLLSVLWVAVSLAAVQALDLRVGWWTFDGSSAALLRMPVEVYLGWVALWGALPAMLFRRTRVAWVIVAFAGFDAVTMPLCWPVIVLARGWWVGECAALGLVLLPAVLLGRWTLEDRRVEWRGAMQLLIAGGLFLWLLPEIVFAVRRGAWSAMPRGQTAALLAQAVVLLALPGVSAVQEFCERGGGTPIPQDSPKRLVVSGVYRYVANPMQCSCALVMLLWGAVLHSGWVAAVAAMSVVYSAGIARWDEREDLRGRFGGQWERYRAEVRDWRWRWRPYVEPGSEATLYVSETCGMCSEVAAWFVVRRPVGMRIVAAERYPGSALRRMRYEAAGGEAGEDGLRAFARGLEHLNAGWMLVGAAMRLPVVREVLQVIADASGMGPRLVCIVNQRGPDGVKR